MRILKLVLGLIE